MQRITLDIPDELAERLKPHQGEIERILRAGLEEVEVSASVRPETPRERLVRVLREKGIARPLDEGIARKYVPDLEGHLRTTPIYAGGRPASEIIIEARVSRASFQ